MAWVQILYTIASESSKISLNAGGAGGARECQNAC